MQRDALRSYTTSQDANRKKILLRNHVAAACDTNPVSHDCKTTVLCDDDFDTTVECMTAPKYEQGLRGSHALVPSRGASSVSRTYWHRKWATMMGCGSQMRKSQAGQKTKETSMLDRKRLDCCTMINSDSQTRSSHAKCMRVRGGDKTSDSDLNTEHTAGSMMGRKSYWRETYRRELENFLEFGDTGESWFDVSVRDRSCVPVSVCMGG